MNVPKIEPIKVTEYETKQSKYPHCGKLPIRSIVLGPSGSGKTVLLTNLILDVYKGCFSRIYIFSPSINVDTTWGPVKNYLDERDLFGIDGECIDEHDEPADLEQIKRKKRLLARL